MLTSLFSVCLLSLYSAMAIAKMQLFAVGYSCNKGMFFKSRGMNHLVGTICMLPILYPFGTVINTYLNLYIYIYTS